MNNNAKFISMVFNNIKNFFTIKKIKNTEKSVKETIIDDYIQFELFSALSHEVNAGYYMTEKQWENYSAALINYLKNNKVNFKTFSENNIIPNKVLVNYFFYKIEQYKSYHSNEYVDDIDFLNNYLIKKSENKTLKEELISFMMNYYKKINDEIKNVQIIFHAQQILNDLSIKSSMFHYFFLPKCIDILKPNEYNYILSTLTEAKNISKNFNREYLKKAENKIEKATKDIKNYIEKHISKKSLSKSTTSNNIELSMIETLTGSKREIIEEIYLKKDKCLKYENLLSIENKVLLNNIFNEHLPKLLNNYFALPENERKHITNHDGKTPNDILEDGLNDINSLLNENIATINSELINALSVKGKHIHYITKGFN